jgi:predicted nucleotidyltransferase
MAADFEAVTNIAKDYANAVRNALPVDRAYLFGSYAKGTATERSDIDVCFFLKSFDGLRRVDVIRKLLQLTDSYGSVGFEPLAFQASELENDNPFVKEILRTGREI